MNDKQPEKLTTIEDQLYNIGLCLFAVLPLAVILYRYLQDRLPLLTIPCILHTFTGYYCPGCGGTRATYGTATVLRTTAALLEIVNAIQNHEIEDSAIFDISPVAIGRSQIKFPMEACGCCGNRNQKQMCETDFT